MSWQHPLGLSDTVGVARVIEACLERVYTSAGPPMGTMHLISPELAGNDVMVLLLLVFLPTMLCSLDAGLAPRCSVLPGQRLTLGMQVSLHGCQGQS